MAFCSISNILVKVLPDITVPISDSPRIVRSPIISISNIPTVGTDVTVGSAGVKSKL